jgi:enamine deaminase RidA (YjgF/YER057c/UK114 family)
MMKSTIRVFTMLCLGLVLTGGAHAQETSKQKPSEMSPASSAPRVEYFSPAGSRPAPFSEAVRVGNMLYLSGKLGTGASGLVSGGIKAETKQTLETIRAVLERNGSSLNEVVKCTVMLADMGEWAR